MSYVKYLLARFLMRMVLKKLIENDYHNHNQFLFENENQFLFENENQYHFDKS